MGTLKKGLGACGLILLITCLVVLNENFGSTAWLLGLGCGAGTALSGLLD